MTCEGDTPGQQQLAAAAAMLAQRPKCNQGWFSKNICNYCSSVDWNCSIKKKQASEETSNPIGAVITRDSHEICELQEGGVMWPKTDQQTCCISPIVFCPCIFVVRRDRIIVGLQKYVSSV